MTSDDLGILVLLLGLVGVGVGIWLATVGNHVGAVIAALIGIVLLVAYF
jgi:hypothetical protein